MKQKKMVAILSLLLTLCLLFTSCGGETEKITTQETEKLTEGLQGEEDPPLTAIPETVLPEEFDYEALLLSITDHGKTVAAKGSLAGEEYKDALSRLEDVLSSAGCKVSLVISSLSEEKALSYNTEARMFCACTVKAAYVYYCLLEMEKGNGSLTETLQYKSEHYESGTGDLQYSPVGTTFSMETVLNKTLTVSDNVGYRMLVDRFGREGYNEWIEELGCPTLKIHPTIWSLKASAKDHAVLWKEIYEYLETKTDLARFLSSICTDTGSDYATQSLENVHVSHKSGHNGSGDWHSYSDAGILWNDGAPYVYAILTDAPGLFSATGKNLMVSAMDIIHGELFGK